MPLVALPYRQLAAVLPGIFVLACQPNDTTSQPPGTNHPASTPAPVADTSVPALCSRPGDDKVRDFFCTGTAPAIQDLTDLEKGVGITFSAASADGDIYSPFNLYDGTDSQRVVFLSHSTALSGALVSPLNPRAIMVGSLTVVAFNRGVQQAELASLDRQSGEINLYLVSFQQACNAAPSGCTHGDLFTPRVESDWTQVSIHEAEDLKNTPSDCRECHQRNVDKPLLLMRELDGPWTHFFAAQEGDAIYPAPAAGFRDIPEPDGADLLGDYLSAKGDESYAGVPTAVLRNTIGFTLENFVTIPQPLVFDGSEIMNERWPWTEADGYAKTPVRSPMWDAAFDAFKRGDQLALPFYAPRVADPDKQAKLTDAYRRYSSGELDADALPDLADIFPDDAQTRAEIGLQSTPDATPAEALVQACGTCHSDVLDQTVSRARFNIAVSRLGRPELDEAIARLKLPRGAAGSMPPPGRRQLDPAAIAPLIAFLKASQHPDRDDAFLEHAAEVGMAAARQN